MHVLLAQQVIQLRSELATLAARDGLEDRVRRHASVFTLDGPAHHARMNATRPSLKTCNRSRAPT